MDYFKVLEEMVEEIKKDEHVVSILTIGKTAKVKDFNFNDLNDVDLLIVYDSNRPFERQVEFIKGVPFDISYISIFDLITQVEGRSTIWVNMMIGSQIYYSKNELVFGIIDRVKDIYLNGTIQLDQEDVDFIRFTLSQKLNDIKNRMQDPTISKYLMQLLFQQLLEDYYALNEIWFPNPKNVIDKLAIASEPLWNLSKSFLNTSSLEEQLIIIEKMLQWILEPFGGMLNEWKKGHYYISK